MFAGPQYGRAFRLRDLAARTEEVGRSDLNAVLDGNSEELGLMLCGNMPPGATLLTGICPTPNGRVVKAEPSRDDCDAATTADDGLCGLHELRMRKTHLIVKGDRMLCVILPLETCPAA